MFRQSEKALNEREQFTTRSQRKVLAMPDPPTQQSSDQAQTAKGLTDADLQHQRQELGSLGRFLGSKDHAPINIAGFIIVICLMGMLVTAYLPTAANVTPADMLKLFGGIA